MSTCSYNCSFVEYINPYTDGQTDLYICKSHGELHYCDGEAGNCYLRVGFDDGTVVCLASNRSYNVFTNNMKQQFQSGLALSTGNNKSILNDDEPEKFCRLVQEACDCLVKVSSLNRIYQALREECRYNVELSNLDTEVLISFIVLSISSYMKREATMFYVPLDQCEKSVRKVRPKDNLKKFVDTIVGKCLLSDIDCVERL